MTKFNAFHRLARTLLFAFLAATVVLLSPTRADDAPKAPATTGKCMMWKVASPTATVYLMGSIHLASPDMYPLPKEMEEAFAKSSTLVVEVNMNKVDQAAIMRFMQENGMYPAGDSLTAHISKESGAALAEFCTGVNFPANAFNQLKPWVVSMTVEVMGVQKLGYNPKLGIDMHFIELAEKSNKPIEELESIEFQLKMLSGFDPALQVKALDSTLEELKDLKDDIGQLKESWMAGDVPKLTDLLDKSYKKHPDLMIYKTKIIDDRNGPMAEKVEKYLKGDQTVIVIAGCAHMVGDKGIVKILQDHHFKVEQSKATKQEAEKKGE